MATRYIDLYVRKLKVIYQFHEDNLLSMFGIKLLDENQKMALLYWTSKQH